MDDYPELSRRVARVRDRIEEACVRSGRSSSAVTIVAVTKGHPPQAVSGALGAGLADIGENRVQELESKVREIGRDVASWHLIGHLQRNKARRALDLADLIHSVDSLRLARRISEEAVAAGRVAEVLVQVNVSGEETKGGLEGEDTLAEIGAISELPAVRVVGLMTMAPFTDDVRTQRLVFASCRSISEAAATAFPGFEARHLSMGMSGDFEAAVEEGSTLVRLGTVLFGERE